MARILQVKNGIAVSEWTGSGAPVPPDPSWTFVDVTERPEAQCGDTYDVQTDTFTPPPPPPDYGILMDPREFWLLFPLATRKAIRTLAKTNQNAEDALEQLMMASPVRTKAPWIIRILTRLVQAGLLTQAEADRIGRGEAPAVPD